MEETVNNSEQENQQNFFTIVTPFSKYSALVLFIILPFVGFWLGYRHAPEKIVEVEKEDVQEVNVAQDEEKLVQSSYLNSQFRVLKIIESEKSPYYLTVATERLENGNDSACGSIYTSKTCYFFLEPKYHIDAVPNGRFVGAWSGNDLYAIDLNTNVFFLDEENVRFNVFAADGPASAEKNYNLSLATGEVTAVDQVGSVQNDTEEDVSYEIVSSAISEEGLQIARGEGAAPFCIGNRSEVPEKTIYYKIEQGKPFNMEHPIFNTDNIVSQDGVMGHVYTNFLDGNVYCKIDRWSDVSDFAENISLTKNRYSLQCGTIKNFSGCTVPDKNQLGALLDIF